MSSFFGVYVRSAAREDPKFASVCDQLQGRKHLRSIAARMVA